jgi:predicted protein tyrosine phosphatase
MEILITDISKVAYNVRYNNVSHVLSLLRGRERNELIMPGDFPKENWLLLDMDDVINETAVFSPTREQVQHLLQWGNNLPENARLLVHCYAGISRSTAAALALKVQQIGKDNISQAINWLIEHRPQACPNPVITKYADEILDCRGDLHKAAEIVATSKLIKLYGSLDNRSHQKGNENE